MNDVPLHHAEQVNPRADGKTVPLIRIRVDGGWLYRTTTSAIAVSLVFVPDPPVR